MKSYEEIKSILENIRQRADKNGVITLNSNENTEYVVSIIALTHWNEVSWLFVLDYLLREFNIEKKLKHWTLQLILGNYEAFYRQTYDDRMSLRFIDRDFNRVWGEEGLWYEYQRREELIPYIQKSNAVLDIHSTSMPSTSMLIPASMNPQTTKVCKNMKSRYVLQGITSKLNGVCLVQYHSNLNKQNVSLLIECGQHFDPWSIEEAKYNTLAFLSSLGIIEEIQYEGSPVSILDIFHCHYAQHTDIEYKYSPTPKSFDILETGTVIAKIWNEDIVCHQDSTIVMPSKKIVYVWEEAWFLAKEIKN